MGNEEVSGKGRSKENGKEGIILGDSVFWDGVTDDTALLKASSQNHSEVKKKKKLKWLKECAIVRNRSLSDLVGGEEKNSVSERWIKRDKLDVKVLYQLQSML